MTKLFIDNKLKYDYNLGKKILQNIILNFGFNFYYI